MDIEKSREYYIAKHREMWTWLSENPDKGKRDWPGWKKQDRREENDCFLCGYVATLPNDDCYFCPIDWGITTWCMDEMPNDSYYVLYENAKTNAHRALYAKIIANLPEKDDI